MIAISSSYDAIITTDITTPLEKYVITNIHEFFTEFGYKLYSLKDKRESTLWRLSIRKDLLYFENYVWEGELPAVHVDFTKYSAAAMFADQIGFQPTSDNLQRKSCTIIYSGLVLTDFSIYTDTFGSSWMNIVCESGLPTFQKELGP
ncbi:hypothetical protein Fcan01_20111 [Folsomia candida]|uniref:Uncharacterized protein n=1 Tax=Folsomia candida TaxID=158441 RepID=A0A226DIE0_FOLCA|nr:hypothetical protein Fcan01_20111 [Folsomia candida]